MFAVHRNCRQHMPKAPLGPHISGTQGVLFNAVGVQAPTALSAPRGCARIRTGICLLKQTRIRRARLASESWLIRICYEKWPKKRAGYISTKVRYIIGSRSFNIEIGCLKTYERIRMLLLTTVNILPWKLRKVKENRKERRWKKKTKQGRK